MSQQRQESNIFEEEKELEKKKPIGIHFRTIVDAVTTQLHNHREMVTHSGEPVQYYDIHFEPAWKAMRFACENSQHLQRVINGFGSGALQWEHGNPLGGKSWFSSKHNVTTYDVFSWDTQYDDKQPAYKPCEPKGEYTVCWNTYDSVDSGSSQDPCTYRDGFYGNFPTPDGYRSVYKLKDVPICVIGEADHVIYVVRMSEHGYWVRLEYGTVSGVTSQPDIIAQEYKQRLQQMSASTRHVSNDELRLRNALVGDVVDAYIKTFLQIQLKRLLSGESYDISYLDTIQGV